MLDRPGSVLGLLALWLVATLGWRPLLVPDEGRYAEVARAMARAPAWRDALVPTLNGLPFFHKPPLFYAIDLVAIRTMGVGEFAGRFGSAVGAWIMGAALWFAMRRWHGVRTANVGLGVLATTPLYFIAGQYANHDMLVGGLITATVLAFARAADHPGEGRGIDRRWAIAGWVLAALGLLAKGLIGLVLPVIVVAPWLLAQRRGGRILRLFDPLGVLAFAVVGLPWFVAMQLRYPGFYDYFILEQHVRRFAGGATFNNVHGPWFFIVLLPLATLPWSIWLLAALRRLRSPTGIDAPPGRPSIPALYAWWTVAIVGFFSIPGSKLIGYVLPALAPWCALLGLAVAASTAPRAGRRALAIGLVTAALLVVTVGLVGRGRIASPGSSRPLGLALGARIGPDDRVAAVDDYLYDLPFYARLRRPVVLLDDWADPEIARHDNWKKEIADAARFDPALAARILRPRSDLGRIGCGVPAAWVVVAPEQAAPVGALPGAERIASAGQHELWRVPGATGCAF